MTSCETRRRRIDHGSSGAPLLNPEGQVIGMNTYQVGKQLGLALKVAHARGAIEAAKSAKPMVLPFPPAMGESALAWSSREVGPVMRSFGKEVETLQTSGQSEQRMLERLAPLQKRYRKKLLKIVHADPASWPAIQASYFLCGMMSDESPDSQQCRQELCSLLLKQHADSPDIGYVMGALLRSADEDARPSCTAI